MALLVILLPEPARVGAQAGTAAPDSPTAPLSWLLSPDGLVISRQGETAPALCPKADTVVAVLPAGAVAWHHLAAPKAPAKHLRAALGGVLEEQLLDDDDNVHLALAPRWTPGAPTWVGAVNKPALQAQLTALAAAGLVIDRLVPALAPALVADGSATTHGTTSGTPGSEPTGHFASVHHTGDDPQADPDVLSLALTDADNALCLPLAGGAARALQLAWSARGAKFTATAAAAAAAELWLGAPVAVRSPAEQALAAVRSPWNLLQFDLAPRHRGSLAAGRLAKQLLGPAWRWARLGLLALVVLQVLGLNVMAWQQQQALVDKREAINKLLQGTHPQVRAVLDAPLQMQRETTALRMAAGLPGDDDFEPMLAAAALAWPEGQAPATQLRFEPGHLSWPAASLPVSQAEALRNRLLPTGWTLETVEGRLMMRRTTPQAQP